MNSKKVKQSQLDSLCDYLSDTAICFLDPQGRLSDWNTGAERFFGMPEATVIGKLPHMLFEHAPLDESLQEAYRNGHYSGDWRLLHTQENARTVFVTIRSVLEEGQLVGFSLLCHNTLYEEKIAGPSVKALPTVQSQHLFEQLVSHSYSGISLFNAEFKMIYRSPSAARITGFSDIDRFEASINDMIHPADRGKVKSMLDELIREPGASRTCRFRSLHGSGRFIDLECVFTNWLQEPAIEAVVLNFRDISEAKKSEEFLYQAIQELSAYKYALDEAAIVAVTDRQGKITHVNDYFCRISGYSREELIGQDHRLINSGYHDKNYIAELWRSISQGNIWRGELCNRNKNGSLYWVATTIIPFFNDDHRPYRYMAIRFDITAAKAADEELRRKSEQISSLLEDVSDGFIALDESLHYTYVNPQVCRMVQLSPDQMLGKYIWDLFPDVVGTATYHAIEKARTEGVSVINEDYYAPLDLWQENRIYPGANGLSLFISDISERKRAEREQKLLQELTDVLQVEENLQDSLQSVLELIVAFSEADLAEIWLNSADRDLLYLERNLATDSTVAAAFDPEKNIRLMPIGKGLAGKVWLQGEVLFWENLPTHPGFLRKDAAILSGINHAIGIPLTDGGACYGVLIAAFTGGFPARLQADFCRQLGATLGTGIRRKQMKREFRQIFESVPDVICTIGDDRRYKHVNPAMCQLFGYSEEELLSMKIDDLIHPDELENSLARTEHFRNARLETMYFENKYLSRQGKLIHMAWTVRQSLEKGILFCVGKDISEQKELEELLRKASELARIGSWELHPQDGKVFWSPLTKELLEVGSEFEMDWEKAPDFCPPVALQEINSAIEQIIREGGNFDVEIEVKTGQGHTRWVRILGQGEFHEGVCLRVYGSVQDISVRKQHELKLAAQSEALSASEKRYSELFHMSPLPMWVFDIETLMILDVNEAAMELYGYDRSEFLGMSIRDIRPSEEQALLDTVLADIGRSTFQFRPGIFTHLKKNGERIEVEIVSSALQYQEHPARLALMFDVTERNKHLAEIEAQNQRLKDISWQQSHVVRAPLSRIMALVQLLKALPEDASERVDILRHIEISADELDQVIREITKTAVLPG